MCGISPTFFKPFLRIKPLSLLRQFSRFSYGQHPYQFYSIRDMKVRLHLVIVRFTGAYSKPYAAQFKGVCSQQDGLLNLPIF